MPNDTPDSLATPTDLFTRLDVLGIATTTERHAPVFTVDERKDLRGKLSGGHFKCLFLNNINGVFWLVVALEDSQIDLKVLAKRLGAGRGCPSAILT